MARLQQMHPSSSHSDIAAKAPTVSSESSEVLLARRVLRSVPADSPLKKRQRAIAEAVAAAVKDKGACAVAASLLLPAELPLNDLRLWGLSADTLRLLDLLTRGNRQSVSEYLDAVSADATARSIKLAMALLGDEVDHAVLDRFGYCATLEVTGYSSEPRRVLYLLQMLDSHVRTGGRVVIRMAEATDIHGTSAMLRARYGALCKNITLAFEKGADSEC